MFLWFWLLDHRGLDWYGSSFSWCGRSLVFFWQRPCLVRQHCMVRPGLAWCSSTGTVRSSSGVLRLLLRVLEAAVDAYPVGYFSACSLEHLVGTVIVPRVLVFGNPVIVVWQQPYLVRQQP